MYSIKFAGKISAVNLRFPNAREALVAFRRLEEEEHPNMHVVDNRSDDVVSAEELAHLAALETPANPA
jgi:hypothetical protein